MVDLVEKNWDSGHFTVSALASSVDVTVRDELEAIAEELTGGSNKEGLFELKAPMPGIVVKSLVKAGDLVTQGQGLVILEAMKMQNELASEMEGIVQEIFVSDGQMVETGAPLARIIMEDA
ncbi:acetyl-CoA carboxylase biotin carboxyl carrier protein subunit [bacterium]|nr:acetyl-CoA carboxylase biotin carboxyl carrier protein subunit [bacterium]